MPAARIYQRLKSTMQSGHAGTDQWILEYTPAEAKRPDPLMGWAGSGDTRAQIKLGFPDLAAARSYCERHAIEARVVPTPAHTLKLQAYADNFR